MKKRILIVDDSTLVQQMYGARLEEAGYETIAVNDGIQAINKVFTESPDLVLLDIQMPGVNGYQVCRLLKDHPGTKDVPIIIMTSASAGNLVRDPRNWSFQTGANGYYDKDEGGDLVPCVQAIIGGESEPRRGRSLQLKPLTDIEIMTALSHLLDRQLYLDTTRLKELNEQKDAFVANVSHELRSPLAIIKGFLDLLNDEVPGPINAEQRDAIEISLKTINRLTRLTRDLLDISKIEAGKMQLSQNPVVLNEVVKHTAETFAQETARKKVEVKTELAPGDTSLTGDEDRLTQVVVNLVSNALKYTPENGRITLGVALEPGKIRVWVEDTGPGIPEAKRKKIFDKFERIVLEKEAGTGLGLSIAQDIVRLHGGDIWVEAGTGGKGSRFVFELPVKK